MSGCWSADEYAQEADEQSFRILSKAAGVVTGQEKVFAVDRPVDTLRKRLLESNETVVLDLKSALDVAAENSRDFQSQKETLYRAALSLTQSQNDFAVRYGNSSSATVSGTDDTGETLRFTNALQSSVNTDSGGRLVASFATNFLESLISGDTALRGPQNILSVTLSQPLLQGFGARIVRENLTQAERDVVYAMRSFERFRSGLTLRIVQDYYNILQLKENVRSVEVNYESLKSQVVQLRDMVAAGRNSAEDLDQAKQSELSAESQVIRTKAQLGAALDNFKLTLGLPTTSTLELDPVEFQRLAEVSLAELQQTEDNLVAYALNHRMDYRTVRDQVADAARQIYIAEDSLRSALDFSSALDIPNEASGKPFKIDWDNISWSAGFNLDLALDRLTQRNAYRRALISFAAAIRAREEFTDQIRADIRDSLRSLRALEANYLIEQAGVANAIRRVDRTEMLIAAGGRGNVRTRDVLLAKESKIASELSLTGVMVNFAVAKLQLLRDLDALHLEPKGLRYDPALRIPNEATRPPTRPDVPTEEIQR